MSLKCCLFFFADLFLWLNPEPHSDSNVFRLKISLYMLILQGYESIIVEIRVLNITIDSHDKSGEEKNEYRACWENLNDDTKDVDNQNIRISSPSLRGLQMSTLCSRSLKQDFRTSGSLIIFNVSHVQS